MQRATAERDDSRGPPLLRRRAQRLALEPVRRADLSRGRSGSRVRASRVPPQPRAGGDHHRWPGARDRREHRGLRPAQRHAADAARCVGSGFRRTRPPRLVGWRIARMGLRRLSRRCATCRATREWKRRGCCANPRGSLARRRRSTDTPQQVPVETVSGTFMDTFGARPLYGRLLAPADETPGAPPVAALGYMFWVRHFDADPDIVGRRVWLNGKPVEIVGVTGRSFTGLNNYPPAFWMTFNGQRARGPRRRPYRVCRAAAGQRSPSWRGHRRR